MRYYPNDFVEQVRLASDIVSIIEEDTALKGAGDRWTGICPFPEHNEKTPSFSVSQSKQLYHCFGCQNSGNIFTYLKKQRGMSFSESVEYLARKQGLSIPQSRAVKSPHLSQALLNLSEKICKFYEQRLSRLDRHQPVWRYLKKRGWTEDIIKHFRLGYAPSGGALLSFLKDPREQQSGLDLGLLNQPDGRDKYDNFRHRLIFPILSERKRVIGFGARALDDSPPKYINSKESRIFHKGRIFYGLNHSARYLRQESFALVVEGYTDFLSLWQEGFKNLVATLGTALTKHHASLLKRYVDTAILVFDGDTAGLRASERSLPLLLSEGLKVKFLSLPQGQDPDDFIRSNGKQAFQSLIQSAKDLFFFVLQQKYEDFKEKGRDSLYLIEAMAPLLAQTQNKTLRAVYKQRVLDLFGRDSKLLEKALDENIRKFSRKALTVPAGSSSPVSVGSSSVPAGSSSPVSVGSSSVPAGSSSPVSVGSSSVPAGSSSPVSVGSSSVPAGSSSPVPAGSSSVPAVSSSPQPAPAAVSLAKALEAERLALVLCLESEGCFQRFLALNMMSLLETKDMVEIFRKIKKIYGQNPKDFDKLAHLIINEISDPRLIFKESYPIFNNAGPESRKKIFQDCVHFLQKRRQRFEAGKSVAEMKMESKKEDMRSLEKVFQLTKQRLKQGDKGNKLKA